MPTSPTPTIPAGSRYFRVTNQTDDLPGYPYLEIGPAGTTSVVSTLLVQINPSLGFDGQFAVMGRAVGQAAKDVNAPFEPIPYRVGSLNNVAQISADGQGWPWSKDVITGPAIILIPSTGMSVVLELAAPDNGTCDVLSWDVQGPSSM